MITRFLPAFVLGSAVMAASPKGAVDEVSQASIQAAFRVLQRDYIRHEDLSIEQLNRATLQGLLTRLDFGAELVKETSAAEQTIVSGLAESLTREIAYLRPSGLTETQIAEVQDKLAAYANQGVKHTILDLRVPAAPAEFELAAAMLELFLPRGTLLFKLKQLNAESAQLLLSSRDPVWKGTLIVLVDRDTNNLGETIAAVLQDQKRALIVGAVTRGATVRYETVPLDHGWKLRFARAEVLLPDESSIFRKGLAPDFPVVMAAETKNKIFAQAKQGSIKPFILEQARPRFNETALVNNQNPELDDFIKGGRGEPMTQDRPGPRDVVVQRALDLLRSTDHFAGMKLEWRRAETTAESLKPSVQP